MFTQLVRSLIVFDLLQKFNYKNSYILCVSLQSAFSFSDSHIKSNPAFLLPIFFANLGLAGSVPKFTKIKHPSAMFKTRKGDLLGSKTTLRGSKALDLLYPLLAFAAPELSTIGFFPRLGFNQFGTISLSFPDSRSFPYFVDSEFSRLTFPIGFDISLSFKMLNSKQIKKHALFFSVFRQLFHED